MSPFDWCFYYVQLAVAWLNSVDMGDVATFLSGVSLMQFIMGLFVVITPIKIIVNYKEMHKTDEEYIIE
ncbi:MAG: hypothetical protein MJ230_07630 [bacterium]|nr:hypothetical protein [bacterium]